VLLSLRSRARNSKLTDVFGGFEIWNGSGTNGLEATEFTAVVN